MHYLYRPKRREEGGEEGSELEDKGTGKKYRMSTDGENYEAK